MSETENPRPLLTPAQEAVVIDVMEAEGLYSNRRNDRGGPTKYGITQAALSAYRRQNATVEDVQNLTKEEAASIYSQRYVPKFLFITDSDLFRFVVNAAVNHGPTRAAKMLQAAVGVKEDGLIGPITREAVLNADLHTMYRKLVAARANFYGDILQRDHSQWEFAAGWFHRLAKDMDTKYL